jgi:hypothetical protein
MSLHPIIDKGEVAIDFPDKYYSGGFGRDSSFEARVEDEGVLIRLVRGGSDKRAVSIHLHHFLFAGILEELAGSVGSSPTIDATHREPLLAAVRGLAVALEQSASTEETPPT